MLTQIASKHKPTKNRIVLRAQVKDLQCSESFCPEKIKLVCELCRFASLERFHTDMPLTIFIPVHYRLVQMIVNLFRSTENSLSGSYIIFCYEGFRKHLDKCSYILVQVITQKRSLSHHLPTANLANSSSYAHHRFLYIFNRGPTTHSNHY